MSVERYRGQKYLDVYFLCCLVYLFCCLANLWCHLVHLVCHLPICLVVLSTCCIILSHYGTTPVDLCCLQKHKSHDYLRTHKGCRRMLVLWFKTEVLSVLFPWYKGIFFDLSKSIDQSFHTTLCFIRKCNCSTW